MRKIKVWAESSHYGYIGMQGEDYVTIEVDDNATQEQIERKARKEALKLYDWGWQYVEDGEQG